MSNVLSIISGVLFFSAFFPYLIAIWKDRHLGFETVGAAKPEKATWVIWASLDSIALIGMYIAGAVNGQIVGAVTGAWAVVIAAFFFGKSGWRKFDLCCLGGGVIGILLWQFSGNPVVSIVASSAAILVGALPTFESAINDPEKENKWAWLLWWLSCVFMIWALGPLSEWTLKDASQPVVFLIIETQMMYLVWLRPLIRRLM